MGELQRLGLELQQTGRDLLSRYDVWKTFESRIFDQINRCRNALMQDKRFTGPII